MSTFQELATKHRLTEKSVARIVSQPDDLTVSEYKDFVALQEQYVRMTNGGVRDKWLHRSDEHFNEITALSIHWHPSRMVQAYETDAVYDARVGVLTDRIALKVSYTIRNPRADSPVILDKSGAPADLDLESLLAFIREQAKASLTGDIDRRLTGQMVHDTYTNRERGPLQAKVADWSDLQKRGLRDGWLISRGDGVRPHALDKHPSRTVDVLESDEVVAKRVTGLTAFISAHVTNWNPAAISATAA